jgi:uncharacterized protein with NRDE domain
MCTVSFIKSHQSVIITSNRDEHKDRLPALTPDVYELNGIKTLFPKDPKGNGTWFAYNEFGTVIVLLNGADEKHNPKATYRKSRGLIVLDLISSKQSLNIWKVITLNDIEPFTIVLFFENQLYQLRWNEIEKTCVQLDNSQHHIWSSSTLYNPEIRNLRQQWFENFTYASDDIQPSEVLNFHTNTYREDIENGLIINRKNGVQTKSITQLVITNDKSTLTHFHPKDKEKSSQIVVL